MADLHQVVSPSDGNTKKRKLSCVTAVTSASADAYSRLRLLTSSSSSQNNKKDKLKSGRGSDAGWTHCPLCGEFSRKKFALGRGIAAHLHAVHTPWKPGKMERQKRRRIAERKRRQTGDKPDTRGVVEEEKTEDTWEPTQEEINAWNSKVLQIVQDLEEQKEQDQNEQQEQHSTATTARDSIKTGTDRNGEVIKPYPESLPPFLRAASTGDLDQIKEIIQSKNNNTQENIKVIHSTDRHLSTAEHWAAGGGHLECLKYLLQLRKQACNNSDCNQQQEQPPQPKKMRRRDGKTSLHYAARNGHVDCITYLIDQEGHIVDEPSGDGTTPFHLACFGGHYDAIVALIQTHKCNVMAKNEWGCHAGHWIAMTKSELTVEVRKICHFLLKKAGTNVFVEKQNQGHTPLHKAAQRQNRHVIEWLSQSKEEGGAGLSEEQKQKVGLPDEGGHTPSQIWTSVGGDEQFADWMRTCGW